MHFHDDSQTDFEHLLFCDICQNEIETETYYKIHGDCICPQCIDKYFKKKVSDLEV